MYFDNDWNPEDADYHREMVKIIRCKVSNTKYEINPDYNNIISSDSSDIHNIQILYDKIQAKKLINYYDIMEVLKNISIDQTSFFVSVTQILNINNRSIFCSLINMKENIFYKLIDEMNYVPDIKVLNECTVLLFDTFYRDKKWDHVKKFHVLILRFVNSSIENITFFDSKVPITSLIRKFSRYYIYNEDAIVIFEFLELLLKDTFYHTREKRIEISNYVKTFYTIKNNDDSVFESMGVLLSQGLKPKYDEIKNKVETLLSQYNMVFLSLQDRTETVVESLIEKNKEQ